MNYLNFVYSLILKIPVQTILGVLTGYPLIRLQALGAGWYPFSIPNASM
ncbi:hypothetical protein ACPPVU_04845 [Mucilaginibacter sp. McL0603]